jgi:hypothetical protein
MNLKIKKNKKKNVHAHNSSTICNWMTKGFKNETHQAKATGYHLKQFIISKWLRIGKM